jgi:hypothetical protein
MRWKVDCNTRINTANIDVRGRRKSVGGCAPGLTIAAVTSEGYCETPSAVRP